MSDQNPVLYKNWLKAGLGLLYTKHGIQKIVEDVIAGFHRKTYGNIGSHCKTCTTQNVLLCPTPGICGRRCNFHDNTDPKLQPINCPVNVCQDIRDKIIREHRHSPPSFKNTRAEKWYENPWEIAKCYMAATGYHAVQSADDTDFTGLVSVILNFEPFQHEVNADLTLKGNIFEKARDSRNSIMHNAKMELPTSDLPNHFLTLKSILSDGKRIQSSPEAQAALQKINDLENDLITITVEDEMKIREESLRSIENLRDKSLKELDRKTMECRDNLEQKIKEGRDTLEQKTTEGRDTLKQKTTEASDTLEQKTTEGRDTLEQKTTEGRDTLEQKTTEGKDTLEQKTKEGRDTLEQKTTEGRDTLEQKTKEGRDTLKQKTTDGKDTLEKKTTEGRDTLEQKTTEGKDTLEQKTTEGKDTLEQKAKEGRDTLEQKTTEGKDTLEKKTAEGKDTLEKKTGAGTETLEQKTRDITDTLEKKTTEGKDSLEQMTTEGRDTLEQKTTEGKDTLEQKTTEGKDTLEQKAKEGRDTLEQKTTEGKDTLEKKTAEGKDTLEKKTGAGKDTLEKKTAEGKDTLEKKTGAGTETLEQKTGAGTETLEQKTTEGKDTLEQKTREGKDTLEQMTTEGRDTLEQKITEGRDTLEQKITEGEDTLEQKTREGKDTLEQMTTEGRDTLEQKITEGRDTLEQKITEGEDTLEQKTTEGKDTLEKKTREAIQQGLDDLNAMTEKCTEKLHKRQAELDKRDSGAVDEADGEQNLGGHLDREYLEKKKNLQRELIEFYLSSGVNSSPIPVLFDDEDFEVDDLFIMPQMMIVQHEQNYEARDKINTISELLKSDREKGQFVRRVCIKGKAGYGKTFLCKKIVCSWCKVHLGIEPYKLAENDVTFLKSFDLLFYIPLRTSQATTITEMIKQVIVREGLHSALHEILKRESEKCLIIFDALDEYSAAVGIPESDPREKYSIILTSRPWKIESLRPMQHSLGQKIQLTHMENNDTLIEAVVDRLNKKYGGQKQWTEFKYDTYDPWNEKYGVKWRKIRNAYEKIQHLAEIPVILIQMICMWYDGEDFGDKRTDIYKEMLVYLFKIAEKRRTEMFRLMNEQTTEPKLETKENKRYFKDMQRLFGYERVTSIIFKLAELAFHALFMNKKEGALIFSHSDKGIRTLSKEDVDVCLSVGFLSQEKMHRKVTKREKVISYTHKTFQEFFAGLHIASGHKTIFKDMLQSLGSLDAIMEQREVFIFMIGFKPEILSELSKHIAEVVDSDQRILCYRNPAYRTNDRGFPCAYALGNVVQEIILICIDECGESETDDKVELRDVIVWDEEFKTMIQKLIPRLNCDNIKSLLADVFMGDLLKKINMKQIVKLELVVRSQEEIDLLARMMRRSVQNLAALILDGRSRLTASIKNVLDELVNANQLTNLEFRDFNLSHDEILYMCNMFSRWRQLEVISLGYIMCQTCNAGQCKYSINLSNNARLRDVSLFDLAGDVLLGRNLPIERIQIRSLKHGNIVIQQLKDLKTLEKLSVCGDTFTYFEKIGTEPIEITTTASPEYDIQAHTMSSVSTVITEVIPTLHNLKSFTLFGVDLEDEDLSISCQTREMLIDLWDVRMTLKCMKTLVESILQCPCRIYVRMWAVDIKPEQDSDAALQLIRDSCNVTCDDRTDCPPSGVEFAKKIFSLNFQCNKAIHISFSNVSGDRYID